MMELKNLIAECTAYDFKVMLEEKKPKSWLKSVSAFADTLGGSLFFGIDNDGTVKGLGMGKESPMCAMGMRACLPLLRRWCDWF